MRANLASTGKSAAGKVGLTLPRCRQWEASGARPLYLKYVPTISCLAPWLLHTSNMVFKKCGSLVIFGPPLLGNPGDRPATNESRIHVDLPAIRLKVMYIQFTEILLSYDMLQRC